MISCTATYEFASVVGDMALVPSALLSGMTGERNGIEVILRASTDPARERESGNADYVAGFTVEVVDGTEAPFADATAALALADDVASDVFTQMCLGWPSAGMAGLAPHRARSKVLVNGEPASIDFAAVAQHRSGLFSNQPAAMVLWGGGVDRTALQAAIEGTARPSTAIMLAAQAQHQAAFQPRANPETALVVAASAVEVAAREAAHQLATDMMKPLVDYLLPCDSQAKIAPTKVIDKLLPALGTPQLAAVNSDLRRRVIDLFKARDTIAHQGVATKPVHALPLATAARNCVEWIEDVAAAAEGANTL